MDSPALLRPICLALAALAILVGGLGLVVSILFLFVARSMGDVTAGTSGVVAGAVLIAAGLLSLTMLATRPARSESKQPSYAEVD